MTDFLEQLARAAGAIDDRPYDEEFDFWASYYHALRLIGAADLRKAARSARLATVAASGERTVKDERVDN